MKNKLFLLLLSFVLVSVLSCKAESKKIRIGILPVIDTLPLVIADSEGFFRKEGLDIELVVFNSALERDAAFTAGTLDGAFGDLINFFLMVKNGIDTKLVCESYHTSDKSIMFGLMASPGSSIKNVNDIKNEKIAISQSTIIDFFLDQIAASKNISPEKLNKLEVKAIPVRYQMLISGTVKLALLPEPLVSKGIKDGARLIADDRGLDTTATVIMFKNDFLKDNNQQMKKFIAAYNSSVRTINRNPEKFKDVMVGKLRLPADIKESYDSPLFNEAALPSEKDVMLVYSWMKKNGMISIPVEYQKLIRPIDEK
ncbi:MAG TPA: MetQ/NlpA family ABC transporter substrate-binding protein [Spirochaetota bacterium]|nr:MetQ/NlpA family ABC transporter substrate-binding protein [Spirochaetota bacterium]HPS86561.1 MetQ/NlpA family ABC transporter substrate-binding protein [Spirochaetota bacterium]